MVDGAIGYNLAGGGGNSANDSISSRLGSCWTRKKQFADGDDPRSQ